MAIHPIDPELTRKAFPEGSVVAYTELVRLLEPSLRRHAVRLLGSDRRSDVDDLLQETFERMHRAAASVQVERPVEAWAFVIMRNLCVDWLRAAGRRPRGASEVDPDGEVGQAGQTAEGDRALLIDLRSALMELPLDRQRLIKLVYFNDMPLSEAAAELTMSYGVARSQLKGAFRQLRMSPGLRGLRNTPLNWREE